MNLVKELKIEWFIHTQRLYRYEKWTMDNLDGTYDCYIWQVNPLRRIEQWLKRALK